MRVYRTNVILMLTLFFFEKSRFTRQNNCNFATEKKQTMFDTKMFFGTQKVNNFRSKNVLAQKTSFTQKTISAKKMQFSHKKAISAQKQFPHKKKTIFAQKTIFA